MMLKEEMPTEEEIAEYIKRAQIFVDIARPGENRPMAAELMPYERTFKYGIPREVCFGSHVYPYMKMRYNKPGPDSKYLCMKTGYWVEYHGGDDKAKKVADEIEKRWAIEFGLEPFDDVCDMLDIVKEEVE